MCSLINKQLLLTAYAYLSIMEQQKGQQGGGALQLQRPGAEPQQQSECVAETKAWLPQNLFLSSACPESDGWFFQSIKDFDGTVESFEQLGDESKKEVRRRLVAFNDNGEVIVDTMELLLKLRKNDRKGEDGGKLAALNAFLTARTKDKYDPETIEAVIQADKKAVGDLFSTIQTFAVPNATLLLQNMVTHFLDTSNFKSSLPFMELLLKLRKNGTEGEKLAALGTFLTARAGGNNRQTIEAVIQADKQTVGALLHLTKFVTFEVPEAAALLQGMETHFLRTMGLFLKLRKNDTAAEKQKPAALRTFLTAMAEGRYDPETITVVMQGRVGLSALLSPDFVKKMSVSEAAASLQKKVTAFVADLSKEQARRNEARRNVVKLQNLTKIKFPEEVMLREDGASYD